MQLRRRMRLDSGSAMCTGNRTSRPQTGGSASIVAYAVRFRRLRSRGTGYPLASCVRIAGSGAAEDSHVGRRSQGGQREDDFSGCAGLRVSWRLDMLARMEWVFIGRVPAGMMITFL